MVKLLHWTVLSCAALTLVAADSSVSRHGTLRFDPAETKVEFTLTDVLHTVHGTFQLKRGSLHFDPATGKLAGELVVDAASGDSGSAARDRIMHAHILESSTYPEIVFRPDRVEGTVAPHGLSRVTVHGLFSIHGADHEVDLPAEIVADNGVYSSTLHFEVPYQKWGMKNPSKLFLRVSDKVEITVHTIGRF
jgi:polyisoprenoid-binding protein YceI